MMEVEAVKQIKILKQELQVKYGDDVFLKMYKALDMAIDALEQEPCEDEYIKVPKKALKYRTAGMVAYNVEWLKSHFDLERAVICGEQQPCEDKRLYIKIFADLEPDDIAEKIYQICDEDKLPKVIESLTEYFDPGPCEDCISRQAVLEYIEGSEAELGHDSEKELVRKDIKELPSVTPKPLNPEAEREESKAYCAECDHIEMCSWYPHDGCEWLKTDRYTAGYNAAKREISLSGEYERAYERGKADAQPKMGRWIEEIDDYGKVIGWHCYKCYEDSGFTTDCKWNFCPNCGTQMVEPQAESEDKI